MIQPNTLLQNRYRVVNHIGEGGMGAVYVATDERFGSTVALKETFFRDAVMLRAFEREAKLLNRLRHPALPRVSDHFTEGEGQFLVMEFIAGEDLSAMLERRGSPFPVGDVLRWADELLDALDYLHTQEPSIIHRDIKPQNLKLTPRGQIILLDFGLAKGTPWQASHATASVFGYSRNYAPIEQIQGTGTDTRSDIYSLGATLYHLLTTQPPPDALTRAMAVLNNQADPLRPASEVHAQALPAVAAVIARAMAQTAAGRPPSAAAMREELRRASNEASNESSASDARAIVLPSAATMPPAHGATTPAQTPSEQATQILGARGAQPTVRDAAAQPTGLAARADAATGETTMVNGATGTEATRISTAPVVARVDVSRSHGRIFAVAGLVAALGILITAFVYNFARRPSTAAPQTTNANEVAVATSARNEPTTISQPRVVVRTKAGRFFLVGEDGVIGNALLPTQPQPKFFMRGFDESNTEIAHAENRERVKVFMTLADEWEADGITGRVSNINLDDIHDVRAQLAGDDSQIEVRLGKEDWTKRLRQALETLDAQRQMPNGAFITYIDMTQGARAVVGFNPHTQAAATLPTNNAVRKGENQKLPTPGESGQANESRAETKPTEASPAPGAPGEETFTPVAPPRGVFIPPNVDWMHMTPAERKRFVRSIRRQVADEQRRASDAQQQLPPPPPRRRRQPPPTR
jgi:hypothetical protein